MSAAQIERRTKKLCLFWLIWIIFLKSIHRHFDTNHFFSHDENTSPNDLGDEKFSGFMNNLWYHSFCQTLKPSCSNVHSLPLSACKMYRQENRAGLEITLLLKTEPLMANEDFCDNYAQQYIITSSCCGCGERWPELHWWMLESSPLLLSNKLPYQLQPTHLTQCSLSKHKGVLVITLLCISLHFDSLCNDHWGLILLLYVQACRSIIISDHCAENKGSHSNSSSRFRWEWPYLSY